MRKKLSQKLCIIDFLCIFASLLFLGVLAHLARALDWQSKGDRFESDILHGNTLTEVHFIGEPLFLYFNSTIPSFLRII